MSSGTESHPPIRGRDWKLPVGQSTEGLPSHQQINVARKVIFNQFELYNIY